MFRIFSPWLLLLYCLTCIFCSLYLTLPRPGQFSILSPSYNGHSQLSSLLGIRIWSLTPVFLPLSYLRCLLLFPCWHCLGLLHINFEPKPLATVLHLICQLLQLSRIFHNQIYVISESQV